MVKHLRIQHIVILFKENILTSWINGLWWLYGILSAARSEFLPDALQAKYEGVGFAPYVFMISLAWWTAIAGIIAFAWVFESSFKLHRKILAELERADGNLSLLKSKDTELLRDSQRAQIEATKLLAEQNERFLENVRLNVLPSRITYNYPQKSRPKIKIDFDNVNFEGVGAVFCLQPDTELDSTQKNGNYKNIGSFLDNTAPPAIPDPSVPRYILDLIPAFRSEIMGCKTFREFCFAMKSKSWVASSTNCEEIIKWLWHCKQYL